MSVLNPINILLIEDNQDHAELIVDTLAALHQKNTVVHVSHGEEAIAYLRHQAPYDKDGHQNPDLILSDIKMPFMNGFEVLSELKEDTQLRYIPIIMISTSSTAKDVHKCYELGASGYLSKPLQYKEFIKKIEAFSLYWTTASQPPIPIPTPH